MKVEPVTLEGPSVRLEPLRLEHAPDLLEVSRENPEIFVYIWSWDGDNGLRGLEESIERHLALPDWCPFAIVLRETGRAIGSTSYLEIRPAHRGLEIGSTWIGRPYQGTLVNPENKYLLLRHAFETLGAMRVQLKTDGRNLHSQRAIAKLGASIRGNSTETQRYRGNTEDSWAMVHVRRPSSVVRRPSSVVRAKRIKAKHPLGRAGVWLQGRSEEPCGVRHEIASTQLLRRTSFAVYYRLVRLFFEFLPIVGGCWLLASSFNPCFPL